MKSANTLAVLVKQSTASKSVRLTGFEIVPQTIQADACSKGSSENVLADPVKDLDSKPTTVVDRAQLGIL